ncbi:MAG: hypothetical protein ACOC6F_00885 [bacterium]
MADKRGRCGVIGGRQPYGRGVPLSQLTRCVPAYFSVSFSTAWAILSRERAEEGVGMFTFR